MRISDIVKVSQYAQVEELVEHWVQGLQLDLSALALGQGEEVVRAQLHDDKRVTQTLQATRHVRGTEPTSTVSSLHASARTHCVEAAVTVATSSRRCCGQLFLQHDRPVHQYRWHPAR